jgi:protocatechuate 3,4-dioxygenase beta subunit
MMRSKPTLLLLIPLVVALLALLYARVEPSRPGRGSVGHSSGIRTGDGTGQRPGAGGPTPATAAKAAADYRGVTEGIVRDHEGKPVKGAKVIVSTPHVIASVFTDAEGRYRIDGLSLGKGRIEVRALNRVDVEPRDLSIDPVAGPPLEFQLQEGQMLVGRVLDGRGGGVSGIRVRVDGDSIKESVTSGAGDYGIAGLEPGYVTITASSAEYPQVEARVLITAGRQTYRDITVHRGAAVAGRVADSAGRPVAGATVNVLGRMEDWVVSGDGGEFTLYGVPPDEAWITATHGDYFATSSEELRLRPGELFEGLELVMQLGGRVRGQVLTTENEPAGGVRVGLEVIEAEGGTADILNPTTDGKGAFQISRVPPGRYRVVVRDGSKSSSQEVKLGAEGAVVDDVVLVLAATAPIQGRVQDASGTSVRGAIVEAFNAGKANGDARANAVTEGDGSFSLPGLPEGEYRVRARLPIGGPLVASERVAAGASDLVIQLPAPGALAGTVADTEGKPLTSFELHITPSESDVVRVRETSEGGTFRVDGVAPGQYEVLVQTSVGRSAVLSPVVVEPGKATGGLELRVTAGETVWGTVLFKDGAPAPGVVLVAHPDASLENAPERSTTTNGDGSFSVDALAAGTYRLQLSHQGVTEFSEDIRIPIYTGMTFALPRATTLTIRVSGPDGRPIAGAKVDLDNKYGAVPVRPAVSLDQFPPDQRAAKEAELIAKAKVTDASGVCERGGVPEGMVAVTVSAGGYRDALTDTEVKPTGLSEVSIVLKPTEP